MCDFVSASRHTRAECFLAACTGTRQLGDRLGQPFVLVDIAFDAGEAVRELNKASHGSATLWQEGLLPLKVEEGWDDWSLVDLPPDCETGSAFEASMAGGVIAFELPKDVSIADVAHQVSMALRPRRLQELVIQPGWLQSRGETSSDILVHPRYTMPSYDDIRRASLVTDVIALAPFGEVSRLIWMLVGACLAASDRRRSWWS